MQKIIPYYVTVNPHQEWNIGLHTDTHIQHLVQEQEKKERENCTENGPLPVAFSSSSTSFPLSVPPPPSPKSKKTCQAPASKPVYHALCSRDRPLKVTGRYCCFREAGDCLVGLVSTAPTHDEPGVAKDIPGEQMLIHSIQEPTAASGSRNRRCHHDNRRRPEGCHLGNIPGPHR